MNLFIESFLQLEIINYIFQSVSNEYKKWYVSHLIILLVSGFVEIINKMGIPAFNPIYIGIIAGLIFYYVYRLEKKETILVIILSIINMLSAKYIIYLVFMWSFKINILLNPSSFIYNISSILICSITLLFSHFIICIYRFKEMYINVEYTNVIFVLPTVSLILMIMTNEIVLNYYLYVIVISIGIPISNYITLYYFFISLENIKLKSELDTKQKQLKISKSHTDMLNKQYRSNFEYFHYLIHKINDLNTNITIYDKKLKDGLEELMNDIDSKFNNTMTNSFVLNSVIKKYEKKIDALNITIRNTMFESLYFMDFDDQIKTFEMIVEKAIQNCSNVSLKDRLLIIQTRKIQNTILLKWSMPYVQENQFVEMFNEKFDYDMVIEKIIDEDLNLETYSIIYTNIGF